MEIDAKTNQRQLSAKNVKAPQIGVGSEKERDDKQSINWEFPQSTKKEMSLEDDESDFGIQKIN